ncbi:MAG: mRNA interferase MazF [Acidimicrobiales bacterium]|jgi:mRNA interferase MazF
MIKILQKDIYWADLNSTKGSAQSGKRPVVIISGNTMNEHLPVCIVCPLSSKVKNFSTCTILEKTNTNKLKIDSEVITFQIRTLSQKRLSEKLV